MKSVERGSAVAGFVLVAAPFVLVPLTVISISLISYAKASLLDSAIEGARYAALADKSSELGCAKAIELANQAFMGFVGLTASCKTDDSSTIPFEHVSLVAKVPVFGILSSISELRAAARAPRED